MLNNPLRPAVWSLLALRRANVTSKVMAHNKNTPEHISPTAYYTGAVWLQHHLSHPAFRTWQGRLFYQSLRLPMALSRRFGGPTLEAFLLARHSIIDQQLHLAIQSGKVTQVVEIAAGLSPRGWRFCQHYGDSIRYIEADLAGMAAHKRRLLRAGGLARDNHQVVTLNALRDAGDDSLAALAGTLDRDGGIAVITEGLLNYFDTPTVFGMWQRFARALKPFSYGLYLSDLHLDNLGNHRASRYVLPLLSRFVHGQVHLHYRDEAAAEAALRQSGFHQGRLLQPKQLADLLPACAVRGANLVRVIRAEVNAH